MDGKEELRFIEVVEKTGEQEAKVRVFPQFRLGLNGIQNFFYIIILYWAVKGLDDFEDSTIISVKPYILRADSMPNACVPDLTWQEPSTWKK
jgi:tRNA (Thr-GGU) A37 N-methylase